MAIGASPREGTKSLAYSRAFYITCTLYIFYTQPEPTNIFLLPNLKIGGFLFCFKTMPIFVVINVNSNLKKMKKIYSLIGIISIGSVVFAQNNLPQLKVGAEKAVSSNRSIVSAGKVNAGTDTVDYPTFWGGGQPTVFSSNGGGYVFGVNRIDFGGGVFGSEGACAQGYNLDAIGSGYGGYTKYKIEEVLVWTAYKEVLSQGQPLTVKIQKLDGTVTYGANTIICPGSVLGTATIPYASVDTGTSIPQGLSIAVFNPSVFVSSKYACTVDFTAWANASDTIGIVCSGVGGGIDATLGFQAFPIGQGGALEWRQTDHVWQGGSFDQRSIAIWAVFDATAAGIEGNDFASGYKLSANPNPTNGMIKISYVAQLNTKSTLEVVNALGAKVFVNTISANAGTVNSFDIDTKDLAAGVYYYTVNSDTNRLTKKFTVTK